MVLAPSAVFKAGALLTAGGMTAGAFGAHALQKRLGEKTATWTTGSNYMIFAGVALLAISQNPIASRRLGPTCIVAGSLLFSGSIFALLTLDNIPRKLVGPLTPLGGLLMIGGLTSLVF